MLTRCRWRAAQNTLQRAVFACCVCTHGIDGTVHVLACAPAALLQEGEFEGCPCSFTHVLVDEAGQVPSPPRARSICCMKTASRLLCRSTESTTVLAAAWLPCGVAALCLLV